jgi:Protein of unknown function (DUF3631)
VLALRHVFEAFTKKKATKLFTDDVLAYMVTLDEGPWPEWWGEKVKAGETIGPARRLRRLLDRFDKVKPKTVRIDDVTKKGYDLEPIQLAASRYLPDTPVTTVTPLASAVTSVSDVTDTPQEGAFNGKVGPRGPSDEDGVDVAAFVRDSLAAHDGNAFAAAFELNQIGLEPPSGRATWTAIVIDHVLNGSAS